MQQPVTNIKHDKRALARDISIIENEADGYTQILETITTANTPVIGITGPPGAGKSTLTNALIEAFIKEKKKVAVLCVDPSSTFKKGALLGDRIRMNRWHNNENVYIRSLATRGAVGGLSASIHNITRVVKAAGFDYIIIETVGVGQSEIDIAKLANLTMVVLVPEAGDDIQTMKAGIMEIADIFVVNKSDRPEASIFLKNLRLMLAPGYSHKKTEVPVLSTVATKSEGIEELVSEIKKRV